MINNKLISGLVAIDMRVLRKIQPVGQLWNTVFEIENMFSSIKWPYYD